MKRLKYIGLFCWFVILLVCVSYVSRWQAWMETVVLLRTELEKQEAKPYLKEMLAELKYFPVREDSAGGEEWFYEDGYGADRTFGGQRSHEGIDIMTSNNQPGYFSVQSVSDGVIENIGWLELGGYRIGIRGESGLYYYSAHMESYAENLQKGDMVKAGQLLGYMGNTGYGPEGTRGQFDVHLHFGIYFMKQGEEVSLNPYPFLCFLEQGIRYNVMQRRGDFHGNTIVERNFRTLPAGGG